MSFLKKYYGAVMGIVLVFFSALPVFADIPAGNPITIDDVSGLIGLTMNFLIITSMILAVIFIVLSGIMTMMAQADPAKFKSGLLRLKHAIYGVAVVMGTGVIINTVYAVVNRDFFCQVSVLGICLLK